jgi:ketosteroid isomerase-like protein
MRNPFFGFATVIVVTLCLYSIGSSAQTNQDEAQIRKLEQRFMSAFKAKDIAGIMASYVPDESLFVFDVIPPRQYVGFEAYKKDWQNFLGQFSGPVSADISDLKVTVSGDLAFGHSIQRVAGTLKNGKKLEMNARVTDCYRKVKGKWLIVHEHVSVPVDIGTGMADLESKP